MAKAISIALKTLLTTSASLLGGDLYTITLASGTVLRYADVGQNVVIGGNTYLCGTAVGGIPGIQRSALRSAIGLSVETIDVDLLFDAATRIMSVTPGAFVNAGGFDGARIQIDRFISDDLNDTSRGVVNLFKGLITDADAGSTRATLHAASDLVFLNSQFPRNYFLPACNHALFDAGCGLSKATYTQHVTATGGSNKLVTSANAAATGYFDLGYITVTSGVNAGLQRTVKSFSGGTFELLYPLPAAMANGDLFDAIPGCDKTEATCSGKFSNLGRFRGYPFVPTPETIELGSNAQSPGSAGGGGGAGGASVPTGVGGQFTTFKQQ